MLGADEVLDYRTTNVTEAVRDADVVVDSQGSDHAVRSLRSLRPGGILVSLRLGPGNPALREEAVRLGVRAEVRPHGGEAGADRAMSRTGAAVAEAVVGETR
jgi:NADPH:quinone reductase-like Zn-dependent oxidoreductase